MENVISFLNRLHPLPPPLIAEMRQVLQYTRKRKNEYLVREGEICSYVWYLQKGLARCYYERDEHEVTTWFMQEGNILVLFKSLIRQTESKYNLQAIEDCELYRIRYEDILHVLEKYSEARRIRTMITDKYSNLKDIRIRATSKLTPPERYAYFIRHFPHLLNRITLHHIASYLNISKSSVARARRKKF
ncbi:MAG: Crp/Fnr family transcriptional regulator [Chitinophagaceae bacterium]|nr:Crp/Fnr family transcriptional regulator [Chitinophagaceae bacterium]